MTEAKTFVLADGQKVDVSVVPAAEGDGYAVIHATEASVTVTCKCANGTSVSTTCPTPYNNTCSCLPDAKITCG